MAYASSTTTASGSTATFAIPFPYLEQGDVHVTVDGVLQDDSLLVFPTQSTVTLPAEPTTGQAVVVYRTTPITDLAAQVVDGAFLDDVDINTALTQLLYATQEAVDAGTATATELTTIVDFCNTAMTNAANSAAAAAASAASGGTEASAAETSAAAAAASAVLAASYSGESQAPAAAVYLVGTSNGSLANALVVTASTFISWTLSAGQAIATLIDGSITLAKLAAACFASEAEAEAGTENTKFMTALRVWQAIAAYLTANPSVAVPQTGTLRATHAATAQTGWVLWGDGTIGDASSNGSVRANADTSALFDLYYTYTDVQCPLFTSGGSATTRGVQGDAATAYAAHCAVRMPLGAGRFVGVAGAGMGLTSRAQLATLGAETHAISVGELPSHTHGYLDNTATSSTPGNSDNDGSSPAFGDNSRVTSATGGGSAMSLMNPGTYHNWEVKL